MVISEFPVRNPETTPCVFRRRNLMKGIGSPSVKVRQHRDQQQEEASTFPGAGGTKGGGRTYKSGLPSSTWNPSGLFWWELEPGDAALPKMLPEAKR